jgi:putative transposase
MPQHYYVITVVCRERYPYFACTATARVVAEKLRESSLWSDATPVCWVLMPDHLHALIALGAVTELSSVVRRLKCVTALVANRIRGAGGALWSRAYHDHALRADEDCMSAARYLIANPVRAGLVSNADSYPYWYCAWPGAGGDGG